MCDDSVSAAMRRPSARGAVVEQFMERIGHVQRPRAPARALARKLMIVVRGAWGFAGMPVIAPPAR